MVTKEQFLIDLENTEKELKAYHMLSEAYEILANLPENDFNSYNRLSQKFNVMNSM